MPNFSALRTALYICLLALAALSTGCNLLDSSASLPATLTNSATAGDATMSLKLVLPPQAEGIAASTLIRGANTGFVKIILQVRQPGSAENKSFTVIKTVEVVSGEAKATISALPAGLVVVKAELENAHVSGWREFHGAGDLKAEVNTTVEISPPGSKLPADLLATAMQEAINNDSIMAAADSNIATNLLNAVKLIDINSENIYAQVLATLIEQVAATGMVKLVHDNTARTITAFTGTTQTWQQTYAQLLGSSAISNVLPENFKVVRVIRQGFGDYSLVEWRDDETRLSLITSHNNSTGVKQSLLTNPGRLDLTLPLSGADYLITGYNAFKKCPMICRWNTTQTSSTEMQAVSNKNLEWDHYFTDEPYSNDPTQGQVVANLSIDAAGGISAYVKTPTGIIHPYTIARDSGQATANFTTETALNQPPTVALRAPTEGTSSADNQSLDISAAPPEDSDGIKEVEFLANGEVIGKAVSMPWSFSWSGMNAGSYKLVARAWDNLGFAGLSSPVNVTITESGFGNRAPTVSLTAPAANAAFTSASSVSIEATATDGDGSISKVEFYRGSTLIGSDYSEPYAMTWVQPAAGSYVLTARAYDDKNAKTDSAAVSITVTAANSGSDPELMLSEIGSRLYSNVPFWIEFINKSTNAIQLSDYEIRTPAMPVDGGDIAKSATFQLPACNLAAGAYVIVRFNNNTDNFAGPQVIHATYAATTLPYWGEWGIIDLRKTSTGKTVDFVKFGAIPAFYETTPDPATEWSGTAAPAMSKVLGHSLTRNLESNDDNSASNWAFRGFQTPAAYNDVISDTDVDADGIPDENEAPGKTFCGLPYYDWGARAGTKDIFVHIDYMNPADCPDPLAVTPRSEALQKIQAAFARKAINIHFDAGTLLGSTVAQHCLDGRSHQVDYAETLFLTPELGTANAYVYKAASMPISKLPVFHYCLLGFMPAGSFGGLGEVGGNDYIVTLGRSDTNQHFSTDSSEKLNYLINSQASTIMHELGHNLGLLHGGNEDLNNKPNYFSIMNYMYSNNGLPTIGNSAEGDRYYYYRFEELGEQAFAQYFPSGWWEDIHNNAYSADMILDFSDGRGAEINESSISELAGLGRGGSAGVDFNGDGDKSDTGLSRKLVGTSGSFSTHRDFNDWNAISLKFTANADGQASIRASVVDSSLQKADYLAFDRQKYVTCDPMSTHREH